MDMNPQFDSIKFGKVVEISWAGTDGRDWRGGLYLPPQYEPGNEYPLVIQTHGWDPNKFWIDGVSNAGYAAQALAARGFVVAQTGDDSLEDEESIREGPRHMAMIEGLIDYLRRRGLIDRNRVGLLGWSRTGFHVRYTLTFSKYHFASAVIADGLDGSYFQYFSWLNLGQKSVQMYEHINGAQPFGGGLVDWLKNTTGFNLEKVTTPVRLLDFRTYSLLNNWEWFAGLRHLGKAVEMIWMPRTEHDPIRPAERMTAQQGSVDWFCFWMKEEEDQDPTKTQQYRRWRQLRELQKADGSTDIPLKLPN
jgi:hypothetical protein